jgi:hypothetical protein
VKKLLALVILLAGGCRVLAGAPDSLVSCHFRDATFAEFCSRITETTGMKVYYRDSWVSNTRVTMDTNGISARVAVEMALKGTNLKVSAWNGGLLILPGETLPSSLPLFETQSTQAKDTAGGQKAMTRTEERYITGNKAEPVQTIRVGRKGSAGKTSWVTIRARITEQQSGEPVIGATLFLQETRTGSATDRNGYLSLVLKPGTYTAVFSCVGLQSKKCFLEVLSSGEFSIEMKKSVIQISEVVILGDRQTNIRLKDPGVEKINTKAVNEIPMLMGERDILKVSEMLPGIVTLGEGSAGLIVRGGNYDQNAFYFNKIPIYNTFHLFGFFSAFNSDIVKDFSVYKGYIPLEFGGHLSSVFNITGRQGNRKRFTARGSISPVSATLAVEGPVIKDKSSFLVSGRILYSDWILHQISDPVIRNSKAGFNDLSAAWNCDLRKSKLSVFFYHSEDEFRLSDLNHYKYSTNGASVILNHYFSPSVHGDLSLTYSRYFFNTIDQQQPSSAYEHSYFFDDYRINGGFTHELSAKNTLQYGAGLTFYYLDRGTIIPYGGQSLRLPVGLGTEQGAEPGIYLSDSHDILPWMTLSAGVRLDLFCPLGPRTVYGYSPGAPIDPRYITDTLHFSNGQVIKTYVEPDIRATLNMQTDDNGTVKIAFNQIHQNLFLLNNTVALAPNSQYKLADYHIPPAKCNQISAGVFRSFPRYGWEASVEFYYKHISGYPEFIDGADFLKTPQVETELLPSQQNSYGAEFLLRRTGRKLEGWLSYTFSRSRVQVTGSQPWQQINNGVAYPANWDIPNVLNTVVNYHFSRRVTASGVVTYQTGRPVTYPLSVYYIDGIPYIDYSSRNEYRIPDYFRLDLSLTVEGSLKRKKFMHTSLIFNLYNVTGRDNPYSVYFVLQDGKIKSYQYSVISVPIFTITLLFKLGNYESD